MTPVQDHAVIKATPKHRGWIALGVLALALLLGGVTMLWAREGAVVFFEAIAAGIMSCF